jgi:hypothetical protein
MGVRKVVEVTTKVLMLLAMLTLLLASALPIDTSAALAQEELAQEIVVTGVVSYEGTKADGTPIYGITDESTLGMEWYQQKGYLMEGDYGAYVGKRITVHGMLKPGYAERVLDVTWIEEPYQPAALPTSCTAPQLHYLRHQLPCLE